MRSFLLSLKGKYQAFIIIGTTICLAFVMATLCKLFFDTPELAANTDLISSVYEVMGTIYAILLTFTLWGVWQNFTEAGTSVQNEAYALLDLVHILEASSTYNTDHIRHVVLDYSQSVIEQEWPMLKNFTSAVINRCESTNSSCLQVIRAVQDTTPVNKRDVTLFSHALSLLSTWLDARRTRILIARGDRAKALWPLLFTGAFVLFAFHGLFVAKTMGIWAALLFGTALVIGVTFYLIFSLDCPFDGSLSIDSEPFTLVITILQKAN